MTDKKDDVSELEINEKDKLNLLSERWKNRRRMAYISLIMMVTMTISLFFFIPETKLDKLQDVISWAYMAFASIIGAYMGLSTYSSMKGK